MMFRRVLGLTIGTLFFSVQCFAMTFSQPKEIGNISGTPQGGFIIEGATLNNGTSYKNCKLDGQWGRLYETGVAVFGNGDNAQASNFFALVSALVM